MPSNMSSEPTLYEILGVDSSASPEEIRKAYLKASLKHHPDKNPNDIEGAKARFVKVGHAYEVLGDPTARASYDRSLRGGSAAAAFQNAFSSSSVHDFDSYRDKFDETVAAMSPEEFARAVSVVSAVASVVGSVVGARMASRASSSGLLRTTGSLAGSMMASRLAGDAVQSIHAKSIERIQYKEACRIARQRGDPLPDPPPKAPWETALDSMRESMSAKASSSSAKRGGSSSGTSRRASWQETLHNLDATQAKVAASAAAGVATSLWHKAREEVSARAARQSNASSRSSNTSY